MGNEWKIVPTGDLCTGIYDGPHATPKKTNDGPIFLGISNLSQGRIDLSNTEHLSEEDFVKWTRRITPQPGDVVFSYETRLGEVGLIPEGLKCCLGRRMALMRPNPSKADSRFLLYAYLSPEFQATIRARTIHGSTVDRIPLIEFPSFPIRVPPLDEQKAIAHILGTLDDKIELNQQMNQTLEAIARALFKSWFIDFDPVRAKMDGRQPAGMDAETAALFPAEFEDGGAIGQIPKGWEVKTLGDFIDIKHGYAFKGEFFRDTPPGDILLTPGNFAIGGGFKDDKFKYYVGEIPEEFVLAKGNLVVTMTDLSKLGDTLGYPAIIPTERESHYLHNQRLGKVFIKSKNSISKLHLYYLLRTNEYRHEILAGATGTTVKHTSPNRIQAFKFPAPDAELSLKFAEIVGFLFEKMSLNNDENRNLIVTRDALLPKLLSGEIRVQDAEKIVEAVV